MSATASSTSIPVPSAAGAAASIAARFCPAPHPTSRIRVGRTSRTAATSASCRTGSIARVSWAIVSPCSAMSRRAGPPRNWEGSSR